MEVYGNHVCLYLCLKHVLISTILSVECLNRLLAIFCNHDNQCLYSYYTFTSYCLMNTYDPVLLWFCFLFLFPFLTANSQYIHTTYTNHRRPPLPNYQDATHMAHVTRHRQKHWPGSNKYYRDDELDSSQGR
mgnify:FL=1